jgi:Response regulator containing CheY-like receiver domain and AraC-type DNA-binding domain
MDKIRVMIADDIEETRSVVKKILFLEEEFFEVVGEASNGEDVLKLIPQVRPDVVLMDINMPVLNGLEATERISKDFPQVIVIIMSVQGEHEYLKKAMLYGAKEYIIKPFNYDNLIDTIKITYEKNKERIKVQYIQEEMTYNAKALAFFSSKGGVGKSILAVNSAVILSRFAGKKTLLIDMDLLFGDISMLVNQYTQKTILDLVDDGQLDSYENIKPYLHSYNRNMDILFAPRKPEAAEYITKDSIEKLMNIFKKHYEVIIVDTGINFNDNTLCLLDMVEIILYVSTMDIVGLKNTKLGFGVMQSLGYDKNKVKLVINRANSGSGISKGEVEEVFKDGIFALIPEDEKLVGLSINRGAPFCNDPKYHKQKIGKAIELMCNSLPLWQR